jgi:uncharacterized protein YkvS
MANFGSLILENCSKINHKKRRKVIKDRKFGAILEFDDWLLMVKFYIYVTVAFGQNSTFCIQNSFEIALMGTFQSNFM